MKIARLATIVFTAATGAVFAGTPQEIEHLLNFVAGTSCEYERNGAKYGGVAARRHIEKKYEYYKDRIQSTEDFIKYSATESKLSGKKYQVHCADAPVQYSSDWLLKELRRFRGIPGGNDAEN